jgi:hypothetical protein
MLMPISDFVSLLLLTPRDAICFDVNVNKLLFGAVFSLWVFSELLLVQDIIVVRTIVAVKSWKEIDFFMVLLFSSGTNLIGCWFDYID